VRDKAHLRIGGEHRRIKGLESRSMNTPPSPKSHYGALSVGLHWFMLLLLVAVYACIELREIFPKGSAPREALKTWHFMLGLTVLALVGLRLVARFMKPVPRTEQDASVLQTRLATLVHAMLYVLMIGMPIAGWLLLSAAGKPIPFFGLTLPALVDPGKSLAGLLKEVHEAGGTVGYVLVGAHAAAALFHHYVQRDDTLRRMLPSWR
jgi:superoxide oxidase